MKVTYIDHMGTDLSVVNAARVSFSKKSSGYQVIDHITGETALSYSDVFLIQFLARGCTTGDWGAALLNIEEAYYNGNFDAQNELLKHIKNMPTHWTPFGHTAITLHIKAPLFVARQLGKHQVGLVWNEVSRRYVDDEPEFYIPEVWRKRVDDVKQGSSNEGVYLNKFGDVEGEIDRVQRATKSHYKNLLDAGVAPEMARMVLPQSMYTEWYWTGNLYAFANVFIQRSDSHAQWETQQIAKQMADIIRPLFPVSWDALT